MKSPWAVQCYTAYQIGYLWFSTWTPQFNKFGQNYKEKCLIKSNVLNYEIGKTNVLCPDSLCEGMGEVWGGAAPGKTNVTKKKNRVKMCCLEKDVNYYMLVFWMRFSCLFE